MFLTHMIAYLSEQLDNIKTEGIRSHCVIKRQDNIIWRELPNGNRVQNNEV